MSLKLRAYSLQKLKKCQSFLLRARRSKLHAGFAAVELLIALAVLAVLSAMTYETFWVVRSHKALDTDAERIATELQQARSLTLASKDASQWGVHVASSSLTLFEGSSYTAGAATNVSVPLSPLVNVFSMQVGGGSDVVFKRLSGETTNTGTITIALIASSSEQRAVTIYQTGAIELQ